MYACQADIDSAYRRIPIKPADRWAAAVTFVHKGQKLVARHVAMPFGAVSSVHAWDRIAKLLQHIACTLLMLPTLVYVDDFHGSERDATIGHAKDCFARVVDALLGPGAVAKKKLVHGNPLEVLGLLVTVWPQSVCCKPSPDKVEAWLCAIRASLASGEMSPGDASKTAGGCVCIIHV